MSAALVRNRRASPALKRPAHRRRSRSARRRSACRSRRGAAARALGVSPSVVSHHRSQLEARLGVNAVWPANTVRASLTCRLIAFLEGVWEKGAGAATRKNGEVAGAL